MKNFIKKSFITLAILMATAFPLAILTPTPVSAYPASDCDGLEPGSAAYFHCIDYADPEPSTLGDDNNNTTTGSNCRDFLGFTSWDCGVDIDSIDSEEKIKTEIWKIVANVATDITVAAAYLIIGYVIYGGYLYIFSGGDAGKVATGKKALYHAFMGLAIVMSANIIMNSIRIALLGNSGAFGDCATTNCVVASDMVANVIQWVIGIAGLIAAIFVVYGGIQYTTSSGDPGKVQAAKRMIMYALIGLIIVAIAEIITSFVATTIRNANTTSMTNDKYISKEIYENQA